MKLDSTDFQLMDVPARFAQDLGALDARRRELLNTVHPDRFASKDAASRRVSLQWAMRVNEAYGRLRDPLKRAAYLCELNGIAVDAEDNTAMPIDFLTQQMEWREALEDARDEAGVRAVASEVAASQASLLQHLGRLIDDERDFAAAAQKVRALMFLDRLSAEIERRASVADA